MLRALETLRRKSINQNFFGQAQVNTAAYQILPAFK